MSRCQNSRFLPPWRKITFSIVHRITISEEMANTLTQQIQTRAHELGFELVGITPAEQSQTIQRYRQWIANGYAGKMGYLERHLPLKEDTRTLLQEAKSVISLAMNYWTLDTPKDLQKILGAGKYRDTRGVMTITMSFVNVFYCSLNLSKRSGNRT